VISVVRPCEVPRDTSLRRYKDAAGYADCYVIEIPGVITQQAFITAFYSSPLFKVERTILRFLASKPATDADVERLAVGGAATFSAWRVEAQSSSELLLADFTGRTRSWLMALPAVDAASKPSTLLYFGSAVVSQPRGGSGAPTMGNLFSALLGFHRLYSRLLLAAAGRRVRPL